MKGTKTFFIMPVWPLRDLKFSWSNNIGTHSTTTITITTTTTTALECFVSLKVHGATAAAAKWKTLKLLQVPFPAWKHFYSVWFRIIFVTTAKTFFRLATKNVAARNSSRVWTRHREVSGQETWNLTRWMQVSTDKRVTVLAFRIAAIAGVVRNGLKTFVATTAGDKSTYRNLNQRLDAPKATIAGECSTWTIH